MGQELSSQQQRHYSSKYVYMYMSWCQDITEIYRIPIPDPVKLEWNCRLYVGTLLSYFDYCIKGN